MASAVKKQSRRTPDSPSFSQGPQPMGWWHPTYGGSLIIETLSNTCPEVCLLGNSRSHRTDNINRTICAYIHTYIIYFLKSMSALEYWLEDIKIIQPSHCSNLLNLKHKIRLENHHYSQRTNTGSGGVPPLVGMLPRTEV